MVIFRRTRGPVGGVISGGRSPAVPSLLRDREAGGAKVNTGLIKVIIGLNKVKEEVKTLREIIFFFYLEFLDSE